MTLGHVRQNSYTPDMLFDTRVSNTAMCSDSMRIQTHTNACRLEWISVIGCLKDGPKFDSPTVSLRFSFFNHEKDEISDRYGLVGWMTAIGDVMNHMTVSRNFCNTIGSFPAKMKKEICNCTYL